MADVQSPPKVTLPDYTMFGDTPVYTVNGNVVFGLMVPSVIPDATDQLYTVTEGQENRLDRISRLLYGTPRLWWAIAECSGLVDPLSEVATGAVLRVPVRSRLVANQ